jgi:hypothetical protein
MVSHTCRVCIAASFGYTTYLRLVLIPAIKAQNIAAPPTIPCSQGMTLLPGQSCIMRIEIPVRKLDRDDL